MKLNLTILLSLLIFFYSQAQEPGTEVKKNEKRAKLVVRSQGSLNDIASLDEGYNEFEGGWYALKDYLVQGNVSLIRLNYGTSLSSPSHSDWQQKRKYYLQKDREYREIFLTNQDPSVVSALLVRGATTGQSLANRKFTSSMLTSSQTRLREMMGDRDNVLAKINGMKKVTESSLRKLVKTYNR